MQKNLAMTARVFYICLAVYLPLRAQLPVCPGSASAVEVSQGVSAFKDAKYALAAEHFQAATQVDPGCVTAALYLGNAYMSQYIPGAASPENQAFAEKAREEYQKVLDQQPENQQALESVASLYLNQKKLDDAKIWYEKLTVVNPDSKVAFYTLGVIAWTRGFQALTDARNKMGMKPDDPGPIGDAAVRQELRSKFLPGVQEGIDHLNRAIEIEVEYDDAMAYLNLLYRQKADLDNTPEEYQQDIAKADEWVQKSIDTRKVKASHQP